MKQRIQGMVIGFLMAVMIMGATTVVIATTRTIQATYGVNVVVDGVLQNFSEDMIPFISEGRTFLPVRGIAEALGSDVSWDGATSTVYVLSTPIIAPAPTPIPDPIPTPQPTPLLPIPSPFLEVAPWFERDRNNATIHEATVIMLGQPYANAIRNSEHPLTQWSHHNLNSQYNILTGTIGRIDGSTERLVAIISFIGDGRQLASYTIDGSTIPFDISVDVSGVRVLKIQIDNVSGHGWGGLGIAFANAIIE